MSRFWLTLISVLGVGCLLSLMVWWFGSVSGEEFSADTFQTREFKYYEVPILGVQVSPIWRTASTRDAALFLTQNNLVTPPPIQPDPVDTPDSSSAKKSDAADSVKNDSSAQGSAGSAKAAYQAAASVRWDVVWVQRGSQARRDADAALLDHQLGLRNGNVVYWKQWSQDHPELAGVLWPRIAKLARRELYVLIPGLIERIRAIKDADELIAAIDGYLEREVIVLARDMQAAGRAALAAELIDEALQDDPDNETLLEMRRQSRPAP